MSDISEAAADYPTAFRCGWPLLFRYLRGSSILMWKKMQSPAPADFFQTGFHEVEGWVHERMRDVLELIAEIHERLSVRGCHVEIGVHHGRFFIPCHNVMQLGEPSIAIDIFEDQHQNIDRSGNGNRETFSENVKKYCHRPSEVHAIKMNSLQLDGATLVEMAGKFGNAKLFSIDGSHTVDNTFHDIKAAMAMIEYAGVIFVDDYYSPHWPGVHEAVGLHFAFGRPKIAPFLVGFNKMMLTTVDAHHVFYEAAREKFSTDPSFKEVTMYGHHVVAI
ncbi:class I SAM-dependent methyltransferase [Mesorhizobium sp. AR10]|uniref:class I SAM-dependent methyltransferase n=1 Tax=Mesorhizobium sp. AR10 TaxID=2865839 RepID=UPI00215E491E|nr:class I SAM-dependent methyltransferase [Mesorhizobium sp. AR10]UVK38224.1 class I SAM-dependent methyltransferase [Mesorhizobium sp. AR10]